ncbi:hypothetical protein [Kineosporia succinea]
MLPLPVQVADDARTAHPHTPGVHALGRGEQADEGRGGHLPLGRPDHVGAAGVERLRSGQIEQGALARGLRQSFQQHGRRSPFVRL